jgi:hypothetical protein
MVCGVIHFAERLTRWVWDLTLEALEVQVLLEVLLLSDGDWRSRLFLHDSVKKDYEKIFWMAILRLLCKGARESNLYDASQACADDLVVSRRGHCTWGMWW